jgi:predicted RNA binding protein YcfA (HicA-like mRNA interferase family)
VAKLPRISGKEMVRFLEREGFEIVRVRGSHHFLQKEDLRTSVPVHSGKDMKVGTLRSILRDIQMTPTEFESRLNDSK